MNTPLEPYRTAPAAQAMPGWPQQAPLNVPSVREDDDPVVYVPDAYGEGMVAVRRSQVQPTAPTPARDLAPLPLLDQTAQRLIGAGIGGGALSAGLGWGIGQALTPLAGINTGSFMWLAIMVAAWKLPAVGRKITNKTTYNTTNNTSMNVVNRNRGFSRSTTSA